MNIQAIGNFSQNILNTNKVNFGHEQTWRFDPRKENIDTTAFATKRKLTDIEICKNTLKNARNNNNRLRFSPVENQLLMKALGDFHSKCPKNLILKELLAIEDGYGRNLEFRDIVGALSVMDYATKSQEKAIINLLKYAITFKENNPAELDDLVFVPLEDHPEMLKQLSTIENKYSKLPDKSRGEIMSYAMDIAEFSKYEYKSLAIDAAEKIYMEPHGIAYRVLTDAAKTLTRTEKEQKSIKNKLKFKALINSFTPKMIAKIDKAAENFKTADDEDNYVNEYLRTHNIDIM